MKRPSFQFYPADWRNNGKLRRCSEAARGAWMDLLCVLHDSDEYGICRWPLADLARSAGVPFKLAKELADKDVLKGADVNCKPYVYIPRHAGKDGEAVTLVETSPAPCWFCSRFVRDEYVRIRRGSDTRFDATNQPTKARANVTPKAEPKGGFGGRQGDGSTSSSTSSNTEPPLSPVPGETTSAQGSDSKPQKHQLQQAGKGPLQLRAEALMRRRPETPLTTGEQRAFTKNRPAIQATTEDDWRALEAFYAAPQDETYSRKDLATLLNNWNGEIDRAKAWKGTQTKAAAIVERASLAEPMGWKAFVDVHFPDCPYAKGQPKAGAAWDDVELPHQRMIVAKMREVGQ